MKLPLQNRYTNGNSKYNAKLNLRAGAPGDKSMERRKLSEDEVKTGLSGLSGWQSADNKLHKRFEFNNFAKALAFVNKVGEIAERHDHHPDITFGWGYAEVYTTTHDRGGITDFDFALAKEIDAI